ncbi:MAG: radical SAM protein [Candidatus Omnitrophota bacterium]
MNVTLIYPLLSRQRSRVDENKQYWPPLGLAYIAAVLRQKGHKVQILDRDYIMRKHNFDFEATDKVTLDMIRDFSSGIVGFSATTPNVSDVDAFSRQVKAMDASILTVIGGPHCVGEPEDTLRICAGIDLLVRGEGEIAMSDIARGVDLSLISGLTYRQGNNTFHSNQDSQLIESLDGLPMPARDLLDMKFYTRPSRFISRNLSLRTTHIFTARGCPYNCSYCAGPLMGKRKVRYHSPQRVAAEIEELIDRYNVEAVYFAEDMFLSNKKRAAEMADLFIQRGINKKIVWMAQVSTNVVDDELLSIMKKAGCVHIEYGFESGSQRILGLMNKSTIVNNNKNAALLTRKHGFRFQGNFIVGFPGETRDDFNQTISFIKEVKPNNISLNLFMPLPGTQIYQKLKQEKKLLSSWDDLGNPEVPQMNYADMPGSEFEKLFFKAKLTVVLPLNLKYFLKDNITHPIRLIYVLATQFRSVIIRIFKALAGLIRNTDKKTRVLFVAYHSVAEPIMESQGFSYMRGLTKKNGIEYSLLSFETRSSRDKAADIISHTGFPLKWRYSYYHQKPRSLATLFDIFRGIFIMSGMIVRRRVKIIHARGLISGLMAFLPARIFGVKLFFDSRGLLADKYVGGGLLKEGGLTYRLMRWCEEFLLRQADFFTVETRAHAKELAGNWSNNGKKANMDVIPCCVDLDKFDYSKFPRNSGQNKGFIIAYLGKIGTWYLIEEMLDFFKAMLQYNPSASFCFFTQDDPAHLYQLGESKGIARDKIIVKKPLHGEVPELLSGVDAGIFFINPYKRHNSSPIKYAEYLACGLPVVINSGIGDTDVITRQEHAGVVLDKFSPDNYKKAARELIGLFPEKEALRARCRLAAEKYFSLDDGTNRYNAIYNKLKAQK